MKPGSRSEKRLAREIQKSQQWRYTVALSAIRQVLEVDAFKAEAEAIAAAQSCTFAEAVQQVVLDKFPGGRRRKGGES